jgi:hypothetical protein
MWWHFKRSRRQRRERVAQGSDWQRPPEHTSRQRASWPRGVSAGRAPVRDSRVGGIVITSPSDMFKFVSRQVGDLTKLPRTSGIQSRSSLFRSNLKTGWTVVIGNITARVCRQYCSFGGTDACCSWKETCGSWTKTRMLSKRIHNLNGSSTSTSTTEFRRRLCPYCVALNEKKTRVRILRYSRNPFPVSSFHSKNYKTKPCNSYNKAKSSQNMKRVVIRRLYGAYCAKCVCEENVSCQLLNMPWLASSPEGTE